MCPGEWAQKDISQTGGEAECTGRGRGWSKWGREQSGVGKRNEEEKGDGGERGGSIGKEKEKRGGGACFLLGPAMFPIM